MKPTPGQSAGMGVGSINRRQALAALAAISAAFLLPGCQGRRPRLPVPPQAKSSEPLFDDIALGLLELDPEQATSLGVDKGAQAALRTLLRDRRPEGVARSAETLRSALAEIDRRDWTRASPETAATAEVVKGALSTALDGLALPYGDVAIGGWRNTPYVVIQNAGAYLDIPRFLDGDHAVHNAEDAEAYLARLDAMPAQLDGELERMQAARGMGLLPPAFLLDRTISQMEQSLTDARSGGQLVQSLANRTVAIPGEWRQRASRIVTREVVPALERQLAELRNQRTGASMMPGMHARPHGEAWYAWALHAGTTTQTPATEIHRQGHEELAALHARMDPILRQLGYGSGHVGERMAALGRDARFRFSSDNAGRAEIIALAQKKIDFIRARLPRAFRQLVTGRLEIRRLPLAEEAGAPAAYGGPGSIDGTTPGRIWLNLGDTSRFTRFGVPTLCFHEGIPGHVWQGEYALRQPLVRALLTFNAYSEGWALYAEQLGDELGAYEGDPVGRLGYLQSLAFRACRMVVDTGIHAMGWTRDQAVAWFATASGSPRASIEAEVDRYCSWPGQACGYKVGHSEIVRLRSRTQAELGARYDLRDFNQAVLEGGNVPLDVLAHNVERYIASMT